MTPLLICDTVPGPTPTLAHALRVNGTGLHSGAPSELILEPAPPGWWLIGATGARAPLEHAKVVDCHHATTLEHPDGTRFSTLEHVLALLNGLSLDGVAITLRGGREAPALDGSAAPLCQALSQSGIVLEKRARRVFRLASPFSLHEGEALITLTPARTRRVRYELVFDELPKDMPRTYEWGDDGGFCEDLAPARTFAFAGWLDSLVAAGRARGGSLDNALLFEHGRLCNTEPLRFPDEPVRHKALDLLGDLALLGRPLVATISAYRAGHHLHTRLVRTLLSVPATTPST